MNTITSAIVTKTAAAVSASTRKKLSALTCAPTSSPIASIARRCPLSRAISSRSPPGQHGQRCVGRGEQAADDDQHERDRQHADDEQHQLTALGAGRRTP
ncbi:hypothetical protein [Curtobacterium sp. B18]|uniref:hypothetical protein n=1 Tax=Curtobacterium sp. B18 TaxID=95614 RepID=UPI000A02D1CC|nr:hypothetical protein [Curtobacterium sp. B18]